MKCRLVRPLRKQANLREWFPEGHVIDDPKCYLLVQFGHAVPEDEECREKVNLTPAQLAERQVAGAMAAAGIHPDDRDAFRRGEMTGYHPDGSWVPGPNYVAPVEEDEEEDHALADLPG